jgi:Domain of unknown function (DUF4861)
MTRFPSGRRRRDHRRPTLALLILLSLAVGLCHTAPARERQIVLSVSNPTPIARQEVISVPLAEVRQRLPTSDPKRVHVETSHGHLELPTQIYSSAAGGPPDQLLTLVSVGSAQTVKLRFFLSESAPAPKPLVYGRAVPERKDDFAWENDKVAYRVYGPALQATGEISSGIDVWSKRVSDLIINEWYAKDAEGQRTKNPALTYHKDTGQGLDSYDVGLSRGCGGTAVLSGGKFYVSENYMQAEILADGPIRFQFRLRYAAWQAGGLAVTEEKVIALDAGTHMNRIQSTFSFEGAPSLQVGVGLAMHNHAVTAANPEEGILSIWEPLAVPSAGMDGTGIVVPAGMAATTVRADGNVYFVLNAKPNVPIVYYAGAAWSKADMRDQAAWRKYLKEFSLGLQNPLQLSWDQ